MIHREVSWLRNEGERLCPELRKQVLSWYRPARYTPCFLTKAYTGIIKQRKKIPVIVQMSEDAVNFFSIQSMADAAGCRVKRDLPLIFSFSTEVNEKNLQKLLQNKGVKKVWYDREVRAVLDVAAPSVGSGYLWESGYTGKGIGIAVLDTGIYNHPDLDGRITGFRDLINNKSETYDDNGHGTHVAGCAASSGKKYTGPAPQADVIGVKVLSKIGSGSLSIVIEGVQWCIQNQEQYRIRIINLSLGSETSQSYKDDPVCQAVEKAWDSGIFVCVAAGNSGPQARTINSPGIDPKILTVGATNDMKTKETGDDTIAEFSSRGPTPEGLRKPDVVAPGNNITSLRSPGSFLDKQNKDARVGNWYFTLSGTSMATPVCAGVAAQLLQKSPATTPDELKKLLINTARPLPNVGENDQGAGLIQTK